MRFAIVTGLTLFRCITALLVATVFWPLQAWNVILFLMLAAFLSDFLDGSLARRWKVVSTFGKVADPLADKAICLVILWLAAGYYQSWPYVVAAVLITLYDIITMSLRVLTKKMARPVAAASTLAKVKTVLLMLGLCLVMLDIVAKAGGALLPMLQAAGLAVIGLACAAAVLSLKHYLRQAFTTQSLGSETALEHYPSVLDINLRAWHGQGIAGILLDVDSTLTPWLGSDVLPDIAQKLLQARAKGWVHYIGLVTNSSKRNARRLKKIAQQCGADGIFTPARLRDRKPRPAMLLKAIEQSGLSAKQVAMVGDKLSADVLAAKRARVAKVAWVNPLGDADHPLDKALRRPLEKIIKHSITRKQ